MWVSRSGALGRGVNTTTYPCTSGPETMLSTRRIVRDSGQPQCSVDAVGNAAPYMRRQAARPSSPSCAHRLLSINLSVNQRISTETRHDRTGEQPPVPTSLHTQPCSQTRQKASALLTGVFLCNKTGADQPTDTQQTLLAAMHPCPRTNLLPRMSQPLCTAASPKGDSVRTMHLPGNEMPISAIRSRKDRVRSGIKYSAPITNSDPYTLTVSS